jgi:hypothetical protein
MKDEEWRNHELSQQQLEKPYKRPFKNKKKQELKNKERNLLIVERRKFKVWIHKRREPRLRSDAIGI